MKKTFAIVVAATGLLLSSCTINKTFEQNNTITVSGTGNVTVKPDIVSMKFLVRTTAWNVTQATERNAVNTANVLAALKDVGISSADISTYDYSITQDNSHDYAGQYTVRNTIAVIVRDISITGKVIDAAVKNNIGANGITAFEYQVSDKSTALRQARTLAVQNAQDAASLLAGASGCKVSDVIEIKEDYATTSRSGDMLMKAVSLNSASPVTPIVEGTVTVTSNVTIKYLLTN